MPRVIEQSAPEPKPAPASSTDQDRPGFVGSTSVRVTPFASPLPEFQTVILNPMSSPAFTCAASAVFTIWMLAALTATGSSAHPLVKPLLSESPL